MKSKKDYTNLPAMSRVLNIINEKQEEVQEDVQEATQEVEHKKATNAPDSEVSTLTNTQEVTQEAVQEYVPTKIRTQGRKGFKKPRINMAFDDLDRIRRRADYEGKSVTQFVNDAVEFYLHQHR